MNAYNRFQLLSRHLRLFDYSTINEGNNSSSMAATSAGPTPGLTTYDIHPVFYKPGTSIANAQSRR